jgi:hypothetical protein
MGNTQLRDTSVDVRRLNPRKDVFFFHRSLRKCFGVHPACIPIDIRSVYEADNSPELSYEIQKKWNFISTFRHGEISYLRLIGVRRRLCSSGDWLK